MNLNEYKVDKQPACVSETPPPDAPVAPVQRAADPASSPGFGQWGLHPGVALLVLVLNMMLFGATVGTAGLAYPAVFTSAVALGFITYFAQMRWYGDDSTNAAIKAGIAFLITAIPVAIPAFLTVPAGLVGLMHTLRRK